MKGITSKMQGGNYTLSGKQKKMPGSIPAPKYKKASKRRLAVKKITRA